MLKRFAKSVRAALLTRRAVNLAALADYDGAPKALERIGAIYGTNFPSAKFPPDINLLYAIICAHVDKMLTFSATTFVIEQLTCKCNCNKRRFNPYERDYILYYCKLILVSLTNFADSESFNLARSLGMTYSSLRVGRVRGRLRRRFPIDHAAGTRLDQFMADNG